MRRQTVTNIKRHTFLPVIKKTGSSRNLFHQSPTPDDLSTHVPQEALLHSDSSRVFPNRPINLNLNQKVANLLKIIKDQDEKIKTFESELNLNSAVFMSAKTIESLMGTGDTVEMDSVVEYLDRTNTLVLEEDEKNLEEFVVEAVTRDKQKDVLIFKLKKLIEEGNAKIEGLVQDSVKFKKKAQKMNEAQHEIERKETEIEEIKGECKGIVSKIEEEIEFKEQKLRERISEMQEMAELIQKTEEKRQYSNEYNIFMESNEQKLKDKVKVLESEKEKIKTQILEISQQITKQMLIIDDIEKSFYEIQEALESEKQTAESLAFNLGIAEDALEESLNQHKMQEKKFAADLVRLDQKLESKDFENIDRTVNRYGSISDKYFLAGISKDETLKLQQQYSRLERDLTYAREALERLKKNEIYLKSQLCTKDFMISQIKKLLLAREESLNRDEKEEKKGEKKIEKGKVAKYGIGELQGIIRKMIESYSVKLDGIKCVGCLRIVVDGVFLVPCGHLACSECWGKDQSQCGKCGEEVSGIKSKNLNKLIAGLRLDVDSIMKAGKLLNLS